MSVRGVRGATVVDEDQADKIQLATQELLAAMLNANPGLEPQDISSAIFTVTEDLCSAYPSQAARNIGWMQVPLLCAREIPVPGGLPRCIRVLLHWNTDLPQDAIHHVYLKDAKMLRPDLAEY
ncbi:MAG: chorismate mutase [Anaerolineales bacterium]|jgi:chorismate mutase